MSSLVFPALVVIALLLPGLLCSWGYYRGFWADYPLGRLGPIAEQIPRAIFWAVWLNLSWLGIVSGASHLTQGRIPAVNPAAVVTWVSNPASSQPDAEQRRARDALAEHLPWVLAYFGLLFAYSQGAGMALHLLVRRLHLDWKTKLFRFDNPWHYLLKGEVLSFQDGEYQGPAASNRGIGAADRAGTIVTAIAEFKDQSQLYVGVLVDWVYDTVGNLDRLILEGAKRRPLSNDRSENDQESPDLRYYEIRGHYFVLRMSEIKTINIDYIFKFDINRAQSLAQAEEQRASIENHGLGG